MQENELMFEITITKSGNPELKGNISTFTLDEDEVNYVLQQIKFNLPFVIVVDDSFFCFSPNQCVSIEINPIK